MAYVGTTRGPALPWTSWSVEYESAPAVDPGARVLLVGAHPDDETIGAGRLAAGHDGVVEAVTLTVGERCLDGLDAVEMSRTRLAEWHGALDRLGVSARETPRWPDGSLLEHEAEIEAFLVEQCAGVDVVVAVWEHDPHPDHQAAGRAARRAGESTGLPLISYPVWAPMWMTPQEVALSGSELRRVRSSCEADDAWTSAVAEYPSQTTSQGSGFAPVVPSELLRRHAVQLVVRARA